MKYLALTLPGDMEINGPPGVPTGGFTGAGNEGSDILGWALGLVFVIAVIVVLLFLAWAGLQWITSGGDKEKIAAARNRLVYAIIGLVVIFLSVLIINVILYFFNQPALGV